MFESYNNERGSRHQGFPTRQFSLAHAFQADPAIHIGNGQVPESSLNV